MAFTSAIDARAVDLNEWLNNPPYKDGGSIQEQLQCYALPYGLIGFVSHLLTYWTMIFLARGRDPLLPWKLLRYKMFNFIISTVGLLITVMLTILTMIRCRNDWQIILIAVWKLVFSVTLSAMAIHASHLINWPHTKKLRDAIRQRDSTTQELGQFISQAGAVSELDNSKMSFRKILAWTPALLCGGIIGLTGIGNLVIRDAGNNQKLRMVTYAFIGIAGGGGVLAFIAACFCYPSEKYATTGLTGSFLFGLGCTLVIMTVLFPLYADWALGALAGDLIGVPSRDNLPLYIIYIAAKRLPMFSF